MAADNSLSAYARSIIRNADFRDMRPRLRKALGEDAEGSSTHHPVGNNDASGSSGGGRQTITDPSIAQRFSSESSPLIPKGKPSSDHVENTERTVPLQDTLSSTAQRRVEQLAQQRNETRAQQKDSDREPLYVETVRRDDGTKAEVIVGESTLPQTIFNSANVLIGVGLLSLPLAFRYSGWVFGMLGLLASAVVTKYTAGLLAKCLDVDSSLANFVDIAYVAFGAKGKAVTSLIITMELMVACVGLVILFADSLSALISGLDDVHWPVICGLILLPLNFLPMRWLGFTSFLGIFCSIGIIAIAFGAGLAKTHTPGSLREVAMNTALPEHWAALPLSIGLIMALWEGHSIFPNIYRDMREPPKYKGALRYTFVFVTSVDVSMALVGYLLYGDGLKDELTKNMLRTAAYPDWLNVIVIVLVAVLPLTKFPLHAAPIVSTLEVFFRIDPRAALLEPNRFNQSKVLTLTLRAIFRLLVTATAVIIAILVPSFEIFSALMGGTFGFLTCVILPVAFHLHMFRGQISRKWLVVDWTLMVVSAVLAVVGTVWEFLPRGWMF